MTDSLSQKYELVIWHPLAVPSDKHNRGGVELLKVFPRTYPSYPADLSRSDRERAINAVQEFRDEARSLVEALPEEHSCLGEMYDALVTRLQLTSYAGVHTSPAIAQVAQRHGLVFYDSQSDTLSLPTSLDSGGTQKPHEPTKPPNLEEPDTIITIGPWTVRARPEATRLYYTRIEESGAAHCGCDNCQNYVLVREHAFPPVMMTALESLGVDRMKESEVHYYGRTPAGLHTYRGWFYSAGSIDQGPESWHHRKDGKPERRFHRVGAHFEIGLGTKSKYGFSEWETLLINAGFSDGPCVELDYYADLPWLHDAPEPQSPNNEA